MIKLNYQTLNNTPKIFVVAEVGNNHEGNFKTAKKMIKIAKQCGVDAVKFQSFNPRLYYSVDQVDRIKKLQSFFLSIEQMKDLIEYGKKLKICVFSTPFDVKTAISLNKIQNIFKISSGDNNFTQLIDKVIEFKKPIIISTGLADLSLLKKLYLKIKKKWGTFNKSRFLIFLHCVASYPVPIEESNIHLISLFKKTFKDIFIGYSDHVQGIDASILSATLGAKIIEKHFTLDKNFSDFRDHQISADPQEMKILVSKIRQIEKIFSKSPFKQPSCEKKNIKNLRRSLAASKNLEKGRRIKKEDLIWVRPQSGDITEKDLIGKKLKKEIKFSQKFSKNFI